MHAHTINSDPTHFVDIDATGQQVTRRTPGIATVRIESPGGMVGVLQLAPGSAAAVVLPALDYITTTWDVGAAALVSGF